MSLNFIHRGLANTVILFMFIMGIWALVLYIRNRPLDGNFWGIVAVGEILLIVQISMGVPVAYTGFCRAQTLFALPVWRFCRAGFAGHLLLHPG